MLDRARRDRRGVRRRRSGSAPALAARGARPGARQARARADRGPADRLRGRLRRPRSDDEEDAAVDRGGDGAAPMPSTPGQAAPFGGIRFKSFEAPTRRRGLRTLDAVRRRRCAGDGRLPDGFVVTLPKVTSVDQVEAMVLACERLEQAHGLAAGALRFEIQVETPQAILGPDGTALVARMVHASARPVHRPALRHLRLLGLVRDRRGLPVAWSTRRPTTPRRSCRSPRPAPACGSRDGSTNVLPVGDRDGGARGLAAARAGWSAGRWSAASTRAGTCTRPSCRPGTPRRSRSTARGCRPRPPRLRAYVERTESGFLDEPATARALADFLVRGARLRRDRRRRGAGAVRASVRNSSPSSPARGRAPVLTWRGGPWCRWRR